MDKGLQNLSIEDQGKQNDLSEANSNDCPVCAEIEGQGLSLKEAGSSNTTVSLRLLESPDLVFVIVKYVTEAN